LERLLCAALWSAGAACLPPATAGDGHGTSSSAARAGTALEETLGRSVSARDPGERSAVLVVLDGARWQEVFTGVDRQLAATAGVEPVSAATLMPHVHRALTERGAALGAPGRGPVVTASGPNFVSMPGYTEIFTGRRAHPCVDNDCPRAKTPTIADEIRARSAEASDVAVFASWDRIERAATSDPARIVISAGRSFLSSADCVLDDPIASQWLQGGRRAGPSPGTGNFRPDRFTAGLALRYLEAKRPRFLFLGLGEPDEYAHQGDYAGYLESLRAADAVIGELFAAIDRMAVGGHKTSVFITADHGRARDYRFHGRDFPESARVWLVAAGGEVRARGLTQASHPHHLADVAPTLRLLLGLPADAVPSSGAPIDELLVASTEGRP
jgi:hypothetical protein